MPAVEKAARPLWTVWWDMQRRAGTQRWSKAAEATQEEALQRAECFLRLGFIVDAIRDPKGDIFMDEAQIAERFGISPLKHAPETGEQFGS